MNDITILSQTQTQRLATQRDFIIFISSVIQSIKGNMCSEMLELEMIIALSLSRHGKLFLLIHSNPS